MKEICIRIKELRKQLCMSQVEFAKNLGVTNAHISKIEKGGTVPSDALIKLRVHAGAAPPTGTNHK